MLPKKLHQKLCWDGAANNMNNLPYGWGFYIIEDVDWVVVAVTVISILFAVTLLTIVWSMAKGDVQGGVGIGQYCVAVLAVLICLALRFKD
jgi:type II secretory pathway pseudopilin PulG